MSVIFSLTGNPFVDAGIYVISELAGKRIENIEVADLKRLYPKIIDVYFTEAWKKNLYSIFPNHPVTHNNKVNKIAGNPRRYKELLEALLGDIKPISDFGSCVACGKRSKSNFEIELKKKEKSGIGKHLVPLTGSADFVNFFPNATLGLEMCSACLFAIQFMPIFLHRCGGKFLLIHSNSEKVMRYWAKNCVADFNRQIALGNFTGCYSNDINDPVNSFFKSVEDMIVKYDEDWINEDVFIRFYYFSNYLQSPFVEVFDIPTPVFRFLAYVKQVDAYSEWKDLVGRASGKRRNEVYVKLLDGESIIRYFFKNDREIFGNWNLLKFYLKEVREMEERRINAIREFADRIAGLIRLLDDDKRLSQLERVEDYAGFRNVLRFLAKDAIRFGLNEPLIKFDEYVNLILPDGALGWNEVRDLLLFRIYEVLHSWLKEREVEKEE